jgi:pyruvate,water dikinase
MKFITLFEDLTIHDVPLVGGKNASLGEMIHHLSKYNIPIPKGFAITAEAYQKHLVNNNLMDDLKQQISTIDKNNLETLRSAGTAIRSLIESAPLSEELIEEIRQAYADLEQEYGPECSVAVRSSATAEALPSASFAGQQETYLNIQGIESLLERVPHAFASLYTDRAISYRIDQGFNHLDVSLSVGVQVMINAAESCSGVLFTLDTESGFPDVIFINAAYGLGEPIVQGSVNPDEFYIHKPTRQKGHKALLKKQCGSKKIKMIYDDNGGTCTIDVPEIDRQRYALTDEECLQLADYALVIEKHYSDHNNKWTPMDIEWAKESTTGILYIVQARPETIHAHKKKNEIIQHQLDKTSQEQRTMLVQGQSVGTSVAHGIARVVESIDQMNSINEGDILVTDMTNPDWEPIMKKAAGIVTNRGGRTCHAAIVSRELGIPAIIGTEQGTEKIPDNKSITLDCSSGSIGTVYEGELQFVEHKITIASSHNKPYQLMLNAGQPDEAFRLAQLPHDGVGLARLEFIINASIKVHPMALIDPDKVQDKETRATIDSLTAGHNSPADYFIDILAQQAGTIAAAFYPKPVIIRLSDFKSNEYRRLLGGEFFEPEEENPMLGLRGASRYTHPSYAPAFELECKAMKKIREEIGLVNTRIMLPFVRTVHEAQSVIEVMAQHGLKRGEQGLELYMMCELPSNVLLLKQFSPLFDGFSIGSNDLTQTILGVDRDSELVAPLFDERNEAVMMMLEQAIKQAQQEGKPIGICGQAPSDYPELMKQLIAWGVTSISLSPDAFIQQLSS